MKNLSKIAALCAVFAASAFLPNSSNAALAGNDPFVGSLTGGSSGFTAYPAADAKPSYSSGGLSFGAVTHLGGKGLCLYVESGNGRQLTAPLTFTGKDVYFSFLCSNYVTTVSGANPFQAQAMKLLFNGTQGNVFLNVPTDIGGVYYVHLPDGDYKGSFDTTVLPTRKILLHIVKISESAGDLNFTHWVYDDPTAGPSAGEGTGTPFIQIDGAATPNVGVNVAQVTGYSPFVVNTTNVYIDEVRIGTNFAEVAGYPSTTPALSVSLVAAPNPLPTGSTTVLTATPSATGAPAPVVTAVDFYAGATLIGTVAAPGPYTQNFSKNVGGSVSVTAVAKSASLNATSTVVVVTFTNAPGFVSAEGSGDFLGDNFSDILVYKKPTLSVLNVSNTTVVGSVALTLPDPKAKVLAATHIGADNYIAFQIKKSLRVIKYVGNVSSQQGTDVALNTLGGKVYGSGDVDNDGDMDLFTVKGKTLSVVKGPTYSIALPVSGVGVTSSLPGKLVGAYQLAGNTNVVISFQKGKNPPTCFTVNNTTAKPGALAPTGSGKILGLATTKGIYKSGKTLLVGSTTVYTDKVTLGATFKYGKVVGPK